MPASFPHLPDLPSAVKPARQGVKRGVDRLLRPPDQELVRRAGQPAPMDFPISSELNCYLVILNAVKDPLMLANYSPDSGDLSSFVVRGNSNSAQVCVLQ